MYIFAVQVSVIPQIWVSPLSTTKQIIENKDEDITISRSSETTDVPNNDAYFDETSTIPMFTLLKTNLDKKHEKKGILSSNTNIVQRSQIGSDLPTDVDVSVIPNGMLLSNTTYDQLNKGVYFVALYYISLDTNKYIFALKILGFNNTKPFRCHCDHNQ